MKIKTLTLLLAAPLLLIGCSSPQSAQVKQMEELRADGQIRGSYEAAGQILSSPEGTFTPEQIERANRIREDAQARLLRFHTSHIIEKLRQADFTAGIAHYVQVSPEFPALNENEFLMRNLMRAYVAEGSNDRARETANTILSANPSPAALADVTRFLQDLDRLEAASRDVAALKPEVEQLGDSIGVEFSSILFSPSCIVMNQTDKLSPEGRQTIERYFASLMSETNLRNSLGRIPGALN